MNWIKMFMKDYIKIRCSLNKMEEKMNKIKTSMRDLLQTNTIKSKRT